MTAQRRDRPTAASRASARPLLRGCATGVAAGWALMLGLLWTGVGGVDGLTDRAADGWIGLALLAAGFGSTGAAIGVAVAATDGPASPDG